MEAFQREDVARRLCGAWRQAWLRGPYAEGLEPASESRAKCEAKISVSEWKNGMCANGSHEVRRMPALAAKEMDARVHGATASIRVVPPDFRSLCGTEIRRFARISRVKEVKGG